MSPEPRQPHSLEHEVGMRAGETSARNEPHREQGDRDIPAAPTEDRSRRAGPPGLDVDGSRSASRARRLASKLGRVEWSLLAAIILAVAVTIAMAVFNPG